jgi:hypothetical protein
MAKQTYRVNAPTAVLDHEPGDTFEADLDPVQEGRLLAGGHLVVDEASAPAFKPPAKPLVKPVPSE